MSGLIVFVVVAGIGTIIFLAVFYSKKARIKRKLKNAPIKRIADFYEGDVARIVGNIEFVGEPLIAPLSQRPCAYYHTLIEQKVSSGKSSHWKTIIKEEKTGTFVIRDGNNVAYIQGTNIKSYIVQDKSFRSGTFNDATDTLNTYLLMHGHKSEGFFGFNKTLRYKEGILEEREKVAVHGRGEWKKPSDLNLPESFNRVLIITAPIDDAVYLSDDPDTTQKVKTATVETDYISQTTYTSQDTYTSKKSDSDQDSYTSKKSNERTGRYQKD